MIGIMALAQLQIDTEIIRVVATCALGGIALAFGLSFGLGTRAITRDIVAGFLRAPRAHSGDVIEVDGQRGTLRTITSTQTLLDADDRTIALANSRLLRAVVRHQTPPPPARLRCDFLQARVSGASSAVPTPVKTASLGEAMNIYRHDSKPTLLVAEDALTLRAAVAEPPRLRLQRPSPASETDGWPSMRRSS
mgnify:CR=1 FL=1